MPGAGFYAIHTTTLSFRSDGRWYADDDPVVLGRNDGAPEAIAVVGARRMDARDPSESRIVGPRRRHKVVDGGTVRLGERP